MKALKVVLLVVILLGLGLIADCNESQARQDGVVDLGRVEFEQGITGFPHPVILYP